MSDTERKAVPLPWWAEAGFRFLQVFGFPAAVTAFLLWSTGPKFDAIQATLIEIRERLPVKEARR